MNEFRWLPTLLQTSDALFPTGAYAHSLGFEEFARLAEVRDEAGLREFVELHLLPALRDQELPYLRFAFEAADSLAALCEIDREISAWKLARETREASIAIGRRRLAALRAVSDLPRYADFAAAVARGEPPRRQDAKEKASVWDASVSTSLASWRPGGEPSAHGHHLTVCAVQAAGEGFPLDAVLGAWFFQSIAGACSAALKVIRIGQDGCQRVLRAALAHAETIIAASLHVQREDAGTFDPLLEIAAMRHEFSDERLFIS
jgi:urease accessory protein